MGTNTYLDALKFKKEPTPLEILQSLNLKKQLKTNPRVKAAITALIAPKQGILGKKDRDEFGIGQDYYGFDAYGKGKFVIQHLYCKRSYDGAIKQCFVQITFSVNDNGNVIETREFCVRDENHDGGKIEDLRSCMTITYDPYGIERQLELRKYGEGKLDENKQDKKDKPDTIYRITRNPKFPFVADLETSITIPSKKSSEETSEKSSEETSEKPSEETSETSSEKPSDKPSKEVKTKQCVLLDATDFALLVPDEHAQENHSKLLTEKDLRALGKKLYTEFKDEEAIQKYYAKNLESISKAFYARKRWLFRPYQVGRELTPQESRQSYPCQRSLQSCNAGLRIMARKVEIPEYQAKETSDELAK